MEPPLSNTNMGSPSAGIPPALLAPIPETGIHPDAPLTTNARGHACYEIPLLENDGSNFGSWKIRAEVVLNIHDLWPVIDGTLPRPNCMAPLVDHTEWASKNREARTLIILALKDKPLDTIVDAETTTECWERLLEHYKGRGIQRKMQHLDEIFKTTFTDSDPLEPQINSLLWSVRVV